MANRLIEVGTPSRLSVERRQLVIEREGKQVARVPIEDMGALLLSNPRNVVTQALLNACAGQNVTVIVCNERYLPVAAQIPFSAHSTHAEVLRAQIEATEPTRKRAWQQIVRAKILGQAAVLSAVLKGGERLISLAKSVRSGDSSNVEAQAARYYWQSLFGAEFRRNRDAPGVNAYLNYGYAVMRSSVARAIAGAGLHPAIGIAHKNKYNAFALADDLMEPLRPRVDLVVYQMGVEALQEELDKDTRQNVLEAVVSDAVMPGERMLPLDRGLMEYAASFRRMLAGDARELIIPS